MKGFLLFLCITLTLPLWADPAPSEDWEKMEKMVRTGAITPEAARRERLQVKLNRQEARAEAQRGLASVHPDLKPTRLKRVKIKPMVLFLE